MPIRRLACGVLILVAAIALVAAGVAISGRSRSIARQHSSSQVLAASSNQRPEPRALTAADAFPASPTATATSTPAPTPTTIPPPPSRPASPAPSPPPPPAPPPADWPDEAFASRVLALLNGERAARGLPPLAAHPSLTAAASAYARLLVITDSFGHQGPDGSTVPGRIYAAGFPGPAYLGEVLWWAVGSLPPERVASDWLASEAHRAQVLNPAFRLAGIGCHFRMADRLQTRCVLDMAGG